VSSILSITILSITLFFYADILAANRAANLTLQAQTINRLILEDLRLATNVLVTNNNPDANEPAGGWQTSQPDLILIVSQPAVDSNNEFIFNDVTGRPYQNEFVYFTEDDTFYKRILADDAAPDNTEETTCPATVTGCRADIKLSDVFLDMDFDFYDVNGILTTDLLTARSINLKIDLEEQIYGRNVEANNDIRITLRNPT